ncbi:MAG: AraC family transcriptional regulator [Saprospiraceae bacterium]
MDWWTIYRMLLFFGALQGAVMGGILFRSKAARKHANRFLALLLFFFAYRLTMVGMEVSYTHWTYHVFLEYNWIYGALLFFYVRSYIQHDMGWQQGDWRHFVPVGLEFIFANYVKIQNFYWDGTTASLSWAGNHAYILWMHTPFQLVIFAGVILFYVRKGQQLLLGAKVGNESSLLPESLHWIQLILKAYFVYAFTVIFIGLVDYFFFNFAFNPFYTYPTYLILAGLTYWLALQGFARRNEALRSKTPFDEVKLEELAPYLPLLEAAMIEQKLFTNPTLSLSDLAEAIGLKPYQLTQILNRILEKSFNDFVNAYRVAEAVRMIESPKYNQYTLLSIAYESGFNSKATFNRVVRKITGKSPNEIKQAKIGLK